VTDSEAATASDESAARIVHPGLTTDEAGAVARDAAETTLNAVNVITDAIKEGSIDGTWASVASLAEAAAAAADAVVDEFVSHTTLSDTVTDSAASGDRNVATVGMLVDVDRDIAVVSAAITEAIRAAITNEVVDDLGKVVSAVTDVLRPFVIEVITDRVKSADQAVDQYVPVRPPADEVIDDRVKPVEQADSTLVHPSGTGGGTEDISDRVKPVDQAESTVVLAGQQPGITEDVSDRA
jgi:hypothetical protein